MGDDARRLSTSHGRVRKRRDTLSPPCLGTRADLAKASGTLSGTHRSVNTISRSEHRATERPNDPGPGTAGRPGRPTSASSRTVRQGDHSPRPDGCGSTGPLARRGTDWRVWRRARHIMFVPGATYDNLRNGKANSASDTRRPARPRADEKAMFISLCRLRSASWDSFPPRGRVHRSICRSHSSRVSGGIIKPGV